MEVDGAAAADDEPVAAPCEADVALLELLESIFGSGICDAIPVVPRSPASDSEGRRCAAELQECVRKGSSVQRWAGKVPRGVCARTCALALRYLQV